MLHVTCYKVGIILLSLHGNLIKYQVILIH